MKPMAKRKFSKAVYGGMSKAVYGGMKSPVSISDERFQGCISFIVCKYFLPEKIVYLFQIYIISERVFFSKV